MTQAELSEYGSYISRNFNAAEIANELLLETNNTTESTIELDTAIKKLGFDSNDVNNKVEANIRANSKTLIEEFNQVKVFKEEAELVRPSVNQLNNLFERLDREIINPYNECMNLQMGLKKIHQTNKLLRSLTFVVHLLSRIEGIDKSENSLATKPCKNLYNLSVLLKEFSGYASNSNLNLIKIVRDYVQFSKILTQRCKTVIQAQIKNLLKFPIQQYINAPSNIGIPNNSSDNEKLISNLLSSAMLIDNDNLPNHIELIYTASTKYSVNLILRNLNNTKYLPSYIRSLENPAKVIKDLEKSMKSIVWISSEASNLDKDGKDLTMWDYVVKLESFKLLDTEEMSSISLVDKFWREIALGVDSGVKEVVNRGGPIVKNLKDIKQQLENEVKSVVKNSYTASESLTNTEKLEIRMMLNSVTNFEKRK